jgi:alpha-amylase/alpha-mannosidase (GH57 family)
MEAASSFDTRGIENYYNERGVETLVEWRREAKPEVLEKVRKQPRPSQLVYWHEDSNNINILKIIILWRIAIISISVYVFCVAVGYSHN